MPPISLMAAVALVSLAACSGPGAAGGAGTSVAPAAVSSTAAGYAPTTTVAPSTTVNPTLVTAPPRSALADAVVPLGSAVYRPPQPAPPPPVALSVDSLGIEDAPVVAVGVDPAGAMEVPAADQVGWYRFGPVPGGPGSAVLAAHVAFDGEEGVFRHLDRVEVGDTVRVTLEDGVVAAFVVTATARYPKADLPGAGIFSRSGGARLALVTCGGDFDREARAYRDNVVVYAEPAE